MIPNTENWTDDDWADLLEFANTFAQCEKGPGCGKTDLKDQMVRTEYWGQVKWWCKDCYKKVKDD